MNLQVDCNFCHRKYRSSFLSKHIRRKHPTNADEKRLGKSRIKCVTCQKKFSFREDLREHINVEHTPLTETVTVFRSVEEFKNWLADEEKSLKIHFVRSRQPKKTKHSCETYYVLYCQYDWEISSFITADSKRKRAQKSQGSYKIDGSCPAGMSVRELADGQVRVKYCSTHVGHDATLCHFRMPVDERLMLQEKLKANVTFDDILDEIQESVSRNLRKSDIINRKMLWYLASKLKVEVKPNKRSMDDSTSVPLWLEELKNSESNPFCFYKPQGESYPALGNEDFMLVIATPIQLDMLKEYGENIVCIDSIRGINKYNFQLTTLLVVDDLCEGFPVAFCFSNVIHTNAIKIFFEQIRSKIGSAIIPSLFVSDDCDAYFDAWSMVMGSDRLTKRQLCMWYVDKSWRDNLSRIGGTTITEQEKKVTVYRRLQMLYEEADELSLLESVGLVMTDLLEDEDTRSFGEYFKKEWVSRLESWAFCYHRNCDVNTMTRLKNLHCTLKCLYVKGLRMNCLDTVIHNLFRLVRDKYVDRITNKSLKIEASYLEKDHSESKNIEDENVEVVDDEFKVTENDVVYTVSKTDGVCSENNCNLICRGCDTCVHIYSCTCPEYLIQCNMCKHIHKVAIKTRKEKRTLAETDQENDVDETLTVQVIELIDSPANDENLAVLEQLLNKVQCLHSLLETRRLDLQTQERVDESMDFIIRLVLKNSESSSQHDENPSNQTTFFEILQ